MIYHSPIQTAQKSDQLTLLQILHLISSSKNEDRVYHQALKLGIAILHGGNEEVQRNILHCFVNRYEEGFFPEMRSRIRRSIIEIKGILNFEICD